MTHKTRRHRRTLPLLTRAPSARDGVHCARAAAPADCRGLGPRSGARAFATSRPPMRANRQLRTCTPLRSVLRKSEKRLQQPPRPLRGPKSITARKLAEALRRSCLQLSTLVDFPLDGNKVFREAPVSRTLGTWSRTPASGRDHSTQCFHPDGHTARRPQLVALTTSLQMVRVHTSRPRMLGGPSK